MPICKTYVISLNKRSDRRTYISEHFSSHNIEFVFFDAVDANQISHYRAYSSKRAINNLTAGAIGCAISHMLVWERISKANVADELYVIFEDDVILGNEIMSFMKAPLVPLDVDILFLGSWNNRGRDINYFVTENMFRSHNPRKGLYAYTVTPRGARKLLQLCKPLDLTYGGIDTKIGKLVRNNKLVAYNLFPSIVTVNFNLPSDIYNPSLPDKKMYGE